MDRTSWIGLITCVILLFLWGNYSAKQAAKQAEERRAAAEKAKQEEIAQAKENGDQSPTDTQAAADSSSQAAQSDQPTAPVVEGPKEESAVLENEFLRLHLSNKGAGIARVEMRKHNLNFEEEEPKVSINEDSEHPIGALSSGPGQFDLSNWVVKSKSAESVTFATDTVDKLHIEKTFSLPADAVDPHEILMEVTIRNDSGIPLQTGTERYLYLGCAAPLHFNEWSMQIGFYWLDDDQFTYETVDHFGGRKILGIFGKSLIPHDVIAIENMTWAGVNDQYFTTTIQPEEPYAANLWAKRFPVIVGGDEEKSKKKRMSASEAAVSLRDLAMNPGDQSTLRYRIYAGPKEFSRLDQYEDKRRSVMNYDQIPVFGWFFGWAIKPLASWLIMGLVFVQSKVGSFGLAIIIVTLLIRLMIWPVYAKSARSMKRMSKLTPLMQKIREKYADDPQRMNKETMDLYRKYGVNPFGSCLPMFIQLPVFLAFYRMLWSAVELRHESFLWVKDLAMPDTLFEIPGLGIPFNLLPILMAVTTFVQMAITPKTGDKTQQMIFMLMPFMFLFICYNFASALSLYWTVSNLFSILQTWLMNKMPEPELKERPKDDKPRKKGFMERMMEKAEEQQKQRQGGGGGGNRSGGPQATAQPGQSRTKLASERGERHTKSKRKKKR